MSLAKKNIFVDKYNGLENQNLLASLESFKRPSIVIENVKFDENQLQDAAKILSLKSVCKLLVRKIDILFDLQ